MLTDLWCESLELGNPVGNGRQRCTDEKRAVNATTDKLTDQSNALYRLTKAHLISQYCIYPIYIQHLNTSVNIINVHSAELCCAQYTVLRQPQHSYYCQTNFINSGRHKSACKNCNMQIIYDYSNPLNVVCVK